MVAAPWPNEDEDVARERERVEGGSADGEAVVARRPKLQPGKPSCAVLSWHERPAPLLPGEAAEQDVRGGGHAQDRGKPEPHPCHP